jgi:hypothetical protein
MDGTRDTARFASGTRDCFAVVGLAAFFFDLCAADFGRLLRLRRAAGFLVLLVPCAVRLAMSALHKSNQNHATVPILKFA